MKGLAQIFGKKSVPLFWNVEIETNSHCNRKCSYCPNSLFNRGSKLLSTKVFKKVVDELAELKFTGALWPHHYGEPLIDKRLEKLITYARHKLPENRIEIYTNGDFLTVARFDALIKAGVTHFRVSNHDNRLPPHIKLLLDDKVRQKYIRFFAIDPTKIPLFNRGGLLKNHKTITIDKCNLANNLVIDYHGSVTLCCNDYLSKHTFGNVANQKIYDIWSQPHYQKLRAEITKGDFKLDICQKCSNRCF